MKRLLAFSLLMAIGIALASLYAAAAPMASPSLGLFSDPAMLPAIGLGGLVINQGNLAILYRGFKTAFQSGLGMAKPMKDRVATTVPSSTREEKYGWLGKVPGMREWIGGRVLHGIAMHDYSIKNKSWELTVAVDRDDIEDDQYGVYTPMFQEMGMASAAKPDELVWGLLTDGFTTLCYDGQNYFDTDHPVIQADGSVASVANTDGGAGAPWFLIDGSRALKPIIYQERKPNKFVSMVAEDDPNVFMRKEYVYGVDARFNVGYGFWQFAWGSKQTLDKAHYKTARESMMALKGDHGRPLGIMPTLLVVGPSNEGAGLEILNAERDAAGATNVYKGTAELLVVPWLA